MCEKVCTNACSDCNNQTIKEAVCCFLYNPETSKVLVVTRRNSTEVGLPGGKVDPGETLRQAIIRELYEETNIQYHPDFMDLDPVFEQICYGKDGKNFSTTTYFSYYSEDIFVDSVEEGIYVKWANLKELIDNSPFAEYNKNLLKILNLHNLI